MRAHKTIFSAISWMAIVALAACQPVNESPKPINWEISWAPTQAHEDNTPLTSRPTYELEMATNANAQGPWVVVWSGATTTANLPALPGHKCFRAITVENGVRSEPSEPICATKLADGGTARAGEKRNRG
jgi:hypothetical protein